MENYITITSGMRGRFAVLVDGKTGEPIQTGETCKTFEEVERSAKDWAEAEGFEYKPGGRGQSAMNLGQLIGFLEKQCQSKVCDYGFDRPHSYRGYYERLAFEPAKNVPVKDMLRAAKESMGSVFQGYKGGDFVMTEHTTCYLARYGETGDELTTAHLRLMFGESVKTIWDDQ